MKYKYIHTTSDNSIIYYKSSGYLLIVDLFKNKVNKYKIKSDKEVKVKNSDLLFIIKDIFKIKDYKLIDNCLWGDR